MRRRILVGLLLMTVASVALFFVPAVASIRSVALQTQEVDLQVEAFEAVRTFERTGTVIPNEHHDIAVYSAEGARSLGVGPDTADRPTAKAIDGNATVTEVEGEVVVALPLLEGGALRAAEPESRSSDRATTAILELSIAAVVAVLASVLVAVYLSRRLTRPLVALAASAGQLGAGDFSTRVEPSGLGELDQVADVLNAAASRVGDLVERERRLTGDMAHQLRTPLAGIRLTVESELEQPRSDHTEVLREVLSALDRVEHASNDLIALHRGRRSELDRARVDLRVAAAVERWRGDVAQAGRSIGLELAPPIVAPVRAGALDTALDVLIDNALQHGRGRIDLAVTVLDDAVSVRVSDEGSLPPTVDDPFVAHTAPTSANGIGLSLTRSVLGADQGSVSLVCRRPTTFEIALPAAD